MRAIRTSLFAAVHVIGTASGSRRPVHASWAPAAESARFASKRLRGLSSYLPGDVEGVHTIVRLNDGHFATDPSQGENSCLVPGSIAIPLGSISSSGW
jgi:hypothetical protein